MSREGNLPRPPETLPSRAHAIACLTPKVSDTSLGSGCGSRVAPVGTTRRMLIRRRLILLIYVIVGVVLAANRHYLTNLDSFNRVLSAILAVLLWPLLLLGINLHVH